MTKELANGALQTLQSTHFQRILVSRAMYWNFQISKFQSMGEDLQQGDGRKIWPQAAEFQYRVLKSAHPGFLLKSKS